MCANPDDETFGLGDLLAGFADRGAEVPVVCFTHDEASTVGLGQGELCELRAKELRTAATLLGAGRIELGDHGEGRLVEDPWSS
ncbi:MAG TPA: PIG-L family deacetylase [Acidimicrobiales bacterium]|nr:PIG-L family deacetylase [Acidimicrobiales bacterium]